MHAAIFDPAATAPLFGNVPDPIIQDNEVMVTVRAAGLTNVVRGIAEGRHYASGERSGAIPGLDGVGVLPDGGRVYFGNVRPPFGTFAELAPARATWTFPLPDGIGDVLAAALPNPALSSWLPLRYRAMLQPGENVLVLGATGAAGLLAVQIARHLGAGRVVAAGRNANNLSRARQLGADAVIDLAAEPEQVRQQVQDEHANHGIDVVLDYVWGDPATQTLSALTGHRLDTEATVIRYVSIGQQAGSTISLASETLRSSPISLMGSGGGSMRIAWILESLPEVFALGASGALRIDTTTVPLSGIDEAWSTAPVAGQRVVIVP